MHGSMFDVRLGGLLWKGWFRFFGCTKQGKARASRAFQAVSWFRFFLGRPRAPTSRTWP